MHLLDHVAQKATDSSKFHLWNLQLPSRTKLLKTGAKWPISINFGNIWARNTVWEIISYVPLFVVLELTKLEYLLFLIHRGT